VRTGEGRLSAGAEKGISRRLAGLLGRNLCLDADDFRLQGQNPRLKFVNRKTVEVHGLYKVGRPARRRRYLICIKGHGDFPPRARKGAALVASLVGPP